MRKLIFIPLMSCFLILSFSSCDTGGSSSSSFDPSVVINTAKQGTWKITSFTDSGTDETSHFTGYNFTFGDANVLTATNGTNTYTGNWSVTSDDSDDDDSTDDLDFNIGFASPPDFAELSEDWHIVTYSSSTITLVHISGGGGGNDALVFSKN